MDWLVRQYGQTPHFAFMTYAEYMGEELQDCELVAEVYMRKHVKERRAKHLWATLESVLTGKFEYVIQVKHYNKCRMGIRTGEDVA